MKNRQPTTFTLSDISSGQKMAIFGGALISAGCASLLAMSLSADAGLKTTSNAAQLVAQAASNASGRSSAGAGIDSRDARALAEAMSSAQAMLGQVSILQKLALPGGKVLDSLNSSIRNTQGVIDKHAKAAGVAVDLQAALQAKAHLIQQLMTRLGPYRTSAAGSAAFESASRLQGYTFSGFGLEAAARLEYDITNLSYQLRADIAGSSTQELRAAADELQKATFPLVAQLRSLKASTEEQAAALQGAKQLAAYAGAAATEASQNRAIYSLSTAASSIGIGLSLLMVILGAIKALHSFGGRLQVATKEAQRDEVAFAKLTNEAKAIADGHTGVSPSVDSEATRAVAEALARISIQVQSLRQNAGQFADSVIKRSGASDSAANDIRSCIVDIDQSLKQVLDVMSKGDVAHQWQAADIESLLEGLNSTTDGLITGLRTLQESIDRTDGIRSSVQEGNKRVKHVGEASQAAVMCVEDLASLCEHVQVLSMNAGLEAERAGNHGGGFRLIADDLRALAARMDDTSKKAVEAILQVQTNTRGASDAVESASQRVAERMFVDAVASAYVASSRQSLEAITSAVRHIGATTASERESLLNQSISIGACHKQMSHLPSLIDAVQDHTHGIDKIARSLRDIAAQQA